MDHLKAKDYLGDGVYAGFDGHQIWVYTQEGHRIALEPNVLRALNDYHDNLPARLRELENQKG